jgi:hypothetical protein
MLCFQTEGENEAVRALAATTAPTTRLWAPLRQVKTVWEKMYEPVKPPSKPEATLDHPTTASSDVGPPHHGEL